MISRNKEIAVLFSSMDRNYDIWPITGYFFSKYWPDCPFDIYLGANGDDKHDFVPENWIYINKGPDESWAKSVEDYLDAMDTEYVLFFVEDLALTIHPDMDKFWRMFEYMKKINGVYARLRPYPRPDIKVNEEFGRIDIKSRVPYSTAWSDVIWEKAFLKELLNYGFNPWEFETRAGKTSTAFDKHDKFLSSYDTIIDHNHFVEKGKFYPFIKELEREEEMVFDFSHREFISEASMKKIKLGQLKSKIYWWLPNKYKNRVRKVFGKSEL